MRDVGKNIKSLRTKMKMTQDELAQRLFVTRQTVSNYENGISHPDVDMLLRIAEVFGVEVNTVIYGLQSEPDENRKRHRSVVLLGVTVLFGLILLAVTGVADRILEQYANTRYIYYYSLRVILRNWLMPGWLFLLGWTTMHTLCVFCGTKTVKPPISTYLRWGVVALTAAYVALVLPHTVWMIWNDLQVLYKYKNGFLGTYSSSFSLFPAWDQLAFLVMGFVKPQNALETILPFSSYAFLPGGMLLRLCRKSSKE